MTRTTARLRHRAAVLKTIFPDCYREVDGYWVWGPRELAGCWTAEDLRVMAELLDEANRKWDAEIIAYFDKLHRTDGG